MIKYDDIPMHKRKEICHTLDVCESDQRRTIRIVPGSLLAAAKSAIRVTSAPTRPRLSSSRFYSTVFSLARAHALAALI
jgi:hypothetical protein